MNFSKSKLSFLAAIDTRVYKTIHCVACCIWLLLSAQSVIAAPDAEQRYGPVQANETLWRIATRLCPPDVSTAQMAVALQQANPRAFVNGDIHQLLAGSVLRIPPFADIRLISPAEAAAQLQAPQPDPAPLPVPPVPSPASSLSTPVPAQTNSSPTDQPLLAPWIFWISGIICCLVLLFSLIVWRRRTRERPYPAAFAASATLTPIPVPARTQPAWLVPSEQNEALIAEMPAENMLTLAPPNTSMENTHQIAGIQVEEYPDTEPVSPMRP